MPAAGGSGEKVIDPSASVHLYKVLAVAWQAVPSKIAQSSVLIIVIYFVMQYSREEAKKMPNSSVVLAAVAAGGALGACGRYFLGRIMSGFGGTIFNLPLGTLLANALGCLAAGLLMGWVATRTEHSELLLAFLMTGVLGGFTTFSAFSFETLRLAQSGLLATAAVNVVLNLFVSLVGVVLGWHFIQTLSR